jgi:transcriptional regulator with XRE-family HTH domain
MLSEPTGSDKIPTGTLVYFRARLKQRIYNLIIREFKRSGLSQSALGRRLDMEAAQLSRLLSGPGNLTLETVSDLMFGISGAELSHSTNYPLSARDNTIIQLQKEPASVPPNPATPRSKINQAIIDALREQANAQIPNAA